MTQEPLEQNYIEMPMQDLSDRVAQRKGELGGEVCILAHHYQRDEIVAAADFIGDSLKLSQQAAGTKAKYIVFCGVHFMAESADILSSRKQAVILPNLLAGCAMADMADGSAFQTAMEELSRLTDRRIVPVAYVNSTAAIKALTAGYGGACCTSSNCRHVFEWAFRHGAEKILAIPDQHLGRNIAVAMGHALEECVVYDPAKPAGGLTADAVARAKFILWNGHCYVHQRFEPRHVWHVRERHPGITVIVHPECPHEVVKLADAYGSTEQIIAAVAAGKPRSEWAVGTECNLVNRLAKTHRDRFVRVLSDTAAICAMMHRIDLAHLLWTLDNLAQGRVVNRISVPEEVAEQARVALDRMIAIKPATHLSHPAR